MVGGLSILTTMMPLLPTRSRLVYLQKHQQMLLLHPTLYPLMQMCTILGRSALLARDLAKYKGPFRNGRGQTRSAESMVTG
jgi:hypothetical protein